MFQAALLFFCAQARLPLAALQGENEMVMCAKRLAGVVFCLVLFSSWSLAQTPKSADTPSALRQKAVTLERQGKTTEAEQAWHAIIEVDPQNAEAYANLGLIAARAGNYDKAVPLYRKAVKLNPKVQGVRMNLGLALFKGEHLQQAIQEFSAMLKEGGMSQRDALRLRMLIGMAHYGLGEYAAAVPFLREAAAGDPQNLQVRLVLAHSCLWSRQNQCVVDVNKEILVIDPKSAEADMLAGEALDEMKDSLGALAQFQAAEEANPNEPNVHFGTGYLLWREKHYSEAAAEFQLELKNNPQHAQSMLYLGDTLLQLKRAAEARPYLERSLEQGSSWLANLDLGIIYADAGRNDEALRKLQIAEKLQPDEVNVHWRLARLYRATGHPEEAKTEFDKASKLNKAADENLMQKIDDGRRHPPGHELQQTTSPQQ